MHLRVPAVNLKKKLGVAEADCTDHRAHHDRLRLPPFGSASRKYKVRPGVLGPLWLVMAGGGAQFLQKKCMMLRSCIWHMVCLKLYANKLAYQVHSPV